MNNYTGDNYCINCDYWHGRSEKCNEQMCDCLICGKGIRRIQRFSVTHPGKKKNIITPTCEDCAMILAKAFNLSGV